MIDPEIKIISAAHCIHPKNFERPFERRDIAAVLGHHNIDVAQEEGSITRLLSSVSIHPDWNPNEVKYDADVAVLVMNHEVEFSSFIQPVCITTEPEIQLFIDGFVVMSEMIHQLVAKNTSFDSVGRVGKKWEVWK